MYTCMFYVIIYVKDACVATAHPGAPTDSRASCSPNVSCTRETRELSDPLPLPAVPAHSRPRKGVPTLRHTGKRAGLLGTASHESITYQVFIHWMASFSLNCFSNSYSCKVNTDMFTGADLRSRYVFSTQNKIICKALDFRCSPVCFPTHPPRVFPSRRSISGNRFPPASLSYSRG